MRAILVTGASTGIGRHLTERLSAAGHLVFATARQTSDLEELAKLERVEALRMDVRSVSEVGAALEQVTRCGHGLYAVVNNAGIGDIGPLSTFSERDMANLFDVNVFGPHRVTNACLSLVLEAQGRVVNISSQGGSLSRSYFGPYSMTKFALEAYTIALADELRPHGVHVSVVQPGGIVSAIGDNSMPVSLERFRRAAPPFDVDARAFIGEPIEGEAAPMATADGGGDDGGRANGADGADGIDGVDGADQATAAGDVESDASRRPQPPSIVGDAVMDALFNEVPRSRYLVGTTWEGDRVLRALFERVVDANASPSHGYSRDALIGLLDEALERLGPPDPWSS